MSTTEINMQSILPKEILALEEVYNRLSEFNNNRVQRCIKYNETFQEIFEHSINYNSLNIEETINDIICDLLNYVVWEKLYKKHPQIAQEFTLKFAEVLVKYGGYRIICRWPGDDSCYDFWWANKKSNEEKKHLALEFLRKINKEIKSIIEGKNEEEKQNLLPNIILILNFFYSMTNDENKGTKKELDKITKNSLKLLSKYKYKLGTMPGSGLTCVPLTFIFSTLKSKKTKNKIMKYLMEFANYFHELEMDSSECVINTVYPGKDKKSEVFGMYLNNALLLKRTDLYSGEILDKVLNKLFREIKVKRENDEYFFGEDSREEFLEAFLVIEKICNNPNNLELLLKTDFFEKINKMYIYFLTDLKKSNPESQDEYLNIEEKKMKLLYVRLQLCISIKKHKLGLSNKIMQEDFKPKRYTRKK